MKRSLVVFVALTSCLAAAQDKPASPECTWSMKQAGVPGAPIRVSPAIFNVFLKDTPAGVSPNPESKGLLLLKVVSDEDGRIVDACSVRKADDYLVGAAIKTVKGWKAKPYFLNRKPVKIESVVGLRFEQKAITFEPLTSVPESKNEERATKN